MLHARIARFDVMGIVTLFENLGLELNTPYGSMFFQSPEIYDNLQRFPLAIIFTGENLTAAD